MNSECSVSNKTFEIRMLSKHFPLQLKKTSLHCKYRARIGPTKKRFGGKKKEKKQKTKKQNTLVKVGSRETGSCWDQGPYFLMGPGKQDPVTNNLDPS